MATRLTIAAPRIASRDGIEVRIPLPVRNTIQGGAHGVIKAKVGDRVIKYEMSDLDIQERHLIPNTYDMGYNQLITNTIQDVAMNLIFSTDGMKAMGTCNEGGIGALFRTHGEKGAWKILSKAVDKAGYTLGQDVFFGVDGAADRFYKGNGLYSLNDRNYSTEELMEFYAEMMTENPIIYAEDLFASTPDAWSHWTELTETFGDRIFVSLDDIATTNARLVRPLIQKKCGNMLLLKMNQIGTMLEGLRAAETAHRAGLMTISSHRSTSSIDFMEIEVALALSMARKKMGRCLFIKCGGGKLIERAMRYTVAQQWVEDWDSGLAVNEPISPGVRIKSFKGYPAPLNTGELTLGVRVLLSDGREINAVVPAGTSTGETEAALVSYDVAVKHLNALVQTLELEGKMLGDMPDQIEFTQEVLGLELKEAIRKGQVSKDSNRLELQIAVEMKKVLGANTILALTQAYNRVMAARKGRPPWLTLRESLFEMEKRGMLLDDDAFYDPIINKVAGVPKKVSAHIVRDYSEILVQLDEQHKTELKILDRVFEAEGSLVYDVEFREHKKTKKLTPYLRVRPSSKKGLAKKWKSRADGKDYVQAYDNKGLSITEGKIYVDWVNAKKRGVEFDNTHLVAIPHRYDKRKGKITLLVGKFNELALTPKEKLALFSYIFERTMRVAMDKGYDRSEDLRQRIKLAFVEIPLHEIFERGVRDLYENFIQSHLPQ